MQRGDAESAEEDGEEAGARKDHEGTKRTKKRAMTFPTNGGRWSIEFRLERFGAQVSQRRMSSLAIIKHFDPFEDRLSRLLLRRVMLVVHQFRLQGAEEAFRDGVVVTVARSAHARFDLRTQ